MFPHKNLDDIIVHGPLTQLSPNRYLSNRGSLATPPVPQDAPASPPAGESDSTPTGGGPSLRSSGSGLPEVTLSVLLSVQACPLRDAPPSSSFCPTPVVCAGWGLSWKEELG